MNGDVTNHMQLNAIKQFLIEQPSAHIVCENFANAVLAKIPLA
jgi:hypothetical protein